MVERDDTFTDPALERLNQRAYAVETVVLDHVLYFMVEVRFVAFRVNSPHEGECSAKHDLDDDFCYREKVNKWRVLGAISRKEAVRKAIRNCWRAWATKCGNEAAEGLTK